MKISIITVCRNSEKYLRTAIESVLWQSYSDIEYIIVDGNSIDNTVNIIKEYEPKFNGRLKWISEPDKGIYDAMNKGISMSSGDIIGILNSDDLYCNKDSVAMIADCFTVYGCEAVYGDLLYVDADNTHKRKRYWKAGNYKPHSFKYGWMPPHPTFFVKKIIYDKYGLFRTDFKSAADYEFMLRVVHKEQINITYIPHVLVKMRAGGMSNANLSHRIAGNREDKRAWQINQLKPFWFTFSLKPIRKILQYFR
jgi:glycosyltransferase